jgi:hypothetical protein
MTPVVNASTIGIDGAGLTAVVRAATGGRRITAIARVQAVHTEVLAGVGNVL